MHGRRISTFSTRARRYSGRLNYAFGVHVICVQMRSVVTPTLFVYRLSRYDILICKLIPAQRGMSLYMNKASDTNC